VLAGHSHGGVVALNVALRGRAPLGALALFEPVAVSILRTVGDTKAYDDTKVVFDGYIGGHEAGERDAVRTMVDYWFGAGAFSRMPGAMQDYLRENTGQNVRDVRATFRDQYPLEAVRRLALPVLLVVGSRSPEITFKIAGALSSLAPRGSLVTLDSAEPRAHDDPSGSHCGPHRRACRSFLRTEAGPGCPDRSATSPRTPRVRSASPFHKSASGS
jgi:pimeloyl-ACP methyl ester carboxylesterase